MANRSVKTVLFRVLFRIILYVGILIGLIVIIYTVTRLKDDSGKPTPPPNIQAAISGVKDFLKANGTKSLIVAFPDDETSSKMNHMKLPLGHLVDKFLNEVDKAGELAPYRENLVNVLAIVGVQPSDYLNRYLLNPPGFADTSATELFRRIDSITIINFVLGYFPYAQLFFFFPNATKLNFCKTIPDGGFKNLPLFTKATSLILEDNYLAPIPDLREMKNLQDVQITKNHLSGTLCLQDVLPLESIQKLSLWGNKDITKIEGLELMKSLVRLKLDDEVYMRPGVCDFENLRRLLPALVISSRITI